MKACPKILSFSIFYSHHILEKTAKIEKVLLSSKTVFTLHEYRICIYLCKFIEVLRMEEKKDLLV